MPKSPTQATRRGRVVVETEQCKGCGLCVAACPCGVLFVSDVINSHGYSVAAANDEVGCTGCGICFYTCPEPGALAVHRETPDSES